MLLCTRTNKTANFPSLWAYEGIHFGSCFQDIFSKTLTNTLFLFYFPLHNSVKSQSNNDHKLKPIVFRSFRRAHDGRCKSPIERLRNV